MKIFSVRNKKYIQLLLSISTYLLIICTYIFLDLHPIEDSDLSRMIKLELRLPRAIVASLLAIGISAAGCVTQTIFQNPLASPSVLGASSGAVLFSLLINSQIGTSYHPIAAFSGAFFVLILFLTFWRFFKHSSVETLLVFGFASNTLISAINQLIISLDLLNVEKTTNSLLFLMGDLSTKNWNHVYIGSLIIIPSIIIVWWRSPRFDVLALGKDIAANLGINTNKTYTEALLLAGLLIGGAISIGGIFPFLGLVLPFLTRMLVGPALRQLIPITCFIAASVTLVIDFIAQNLIYPDALYSGVIMALVGSPVFIFLLLQKRRMA